MEASPSVEKPPGSGSPSSRVFTVNDVLHICSTIACEEGIMVQGQPRKQSLFRRFSQDLTKITGLSKSNSDGNIGLSQNETSPILSSKAKSTERVHRMSVVNDSKIVKDKETQSKENIPGLGQRDVVAIAILVDEQGAPIKTYTEHEDIPTDEYDAANQVYISRVPYQDTPAKHNSVCRTISSSGANVKALADYLTSDIEIDMANKLKKRMTRILMRLHTTDLTTAESFLKLQRFAGVRIDIVDELIEFVGKELRMTIVAEEDNM